MEAKKSSVSPLIRRHCFCKVIFLKYFSPLVRRLLESWDCPNLLEMKGRPRPRKHLRRWTVSLEWNILEWRRWKMLKNIYKIKKDFALSALRRIGYCTWSELKSTTNFEYVRGSEKKLWLYNIVGNVSAMMLSFWRKRKCPSLEFGVGSKASH